VCEGHLDPRAPKSKEAMDGTVSTIHCHMTPEQLIERWDRCLPLDEPEGEAEEEEAARVAQQMYDPNYSESDIEEDSDTEHESAVAARWEAKNEADLEEELYVSQLTPDQLARYTKEDDFWF
jgi:hypothetical protein